MNVLSLFNGMSIGKMAFDDMGIKVGKYYSAEIDKYAIQATTALFPDTIQLGSVTEWFNWDIDWANIDYVTGGFPCQAWSMAGKQLGDKDKRGMLFWVMLDIMVYAKYHNPNVKFIIENVKMKKEFEQYITTHTENALGKVYKILINSALVSAQNRNRYYWTSFEVTQPEDCFINCSEVIDKNEQTPNRECWQKWWRKNGEFQLNKKYSCILNDVEKGITQTARQVSSWNGCVVRNNDHTLRFFTPREAFRLQTVPEHHIDTLLSAGISNTQLYKMCGNAWTMKVISHILRHSI